MISDQFYADQFYGEFAYRFQQAESLPNGQKAVIFIGNTRSGKSTLCCAAAGISMSIIHSNKQVTFINPTNKDIKLVKNLNQSITQKPNVFQKNYLNANNLHILVDMPGNRDNQFRRKLANFHYVKTMASNLRYVRFLMVINLQKKRKNNGYEYILQQKQLAMMQDYRLMLPKCREHIHIILNRVECQDSEQKEIKKIFRNLINSKNKKEFRQFYGVISDNHIKIIKRPVYKHNASDQIYNQINTLMSNICNQTQQNLFIELKKEDYILTNLFKNQNQTDNKQAVNQYQNLFRTSIDKLNECKKIFHEISLILIKSIAGKNDLSRELFEKVDKFLIVMEKNIKKQGEDNAEEDNRQIKIQKLLDNNENARKHFKFTYLLQFLKVVYDSKFEGIKQNDYRALSNQLIITYMSKFIQIIKFIYQDHHQLHLKLLKLFLFMKRRNDQCLFLLTFKQEYNKIKQPQIQYGEHSNKIQDFKNLEFSDESKEYKIINDYFMDLNIKKYMLTSSNQISQIKSQLINNFNIIAYFLKMSQRNQNELQLIKQKIHLIQLSFLLYIQLDSNSKVSEIIEKIIQFYPNVKAKQDKILIVLRLAQLFQRVKDYKNSLVLYLILNLNEQVLGMIELIQAQNIKQSYQFYKQIADTFYANGYIRHAIKCLEKYKKQATKSKDSILQLQKTIYKYETTLLKNGFLRLQQRTSNFQSLYNWEQIEKEMAFFHSKFNKKQKGSNAKDYLLHSFR